MALSLKSTMFRDAAGGFCAASGISLVPDTDRMEGEALDELGTSLSGQQRATKRLAPGKTAPTIYDIAALAGVNPSTVSRALSKPGRVSAKTAKIIEDAAAQLNYQVNIFARALPTGRTQAVALIVSDITNPAYFDVIRGAETAASAQDYTLMLAESTESADLELKIARRMMASVDGLILASPRLSDEDIRSLAAQKPVAVLNREVDGVPCVIADAATAVAEAVNRLAVQGHMDLAFLSGPQRSWMSKRRWETIHDAASAAGLNVELILGDAPTLEGGRAAARDVMGNSATAIFCYNDLMAIGLMQQLQTAAVRIPEQRSIIGFDNIFGSDFTSPALSTIASPLRECGTAAFSLVLGQLAGVDDTVGELGSLEATLLLRGSTGPV